MQKKTWKKWGRAAYWLLALVYWETLVHAGMYGQFQATFRFALGFTAAMGLGIGALISFLPDRAAKILNPLLSLGVMVLYGSQMVYCFIFGTPYSVSQIGMGADAMTNFWREMLGAMTDHLPWLLALLVPFVLLIVLNRIGGMEKPGWIARAVMIFLAAALAAATYWGVKSSNTGMYSPYYFFTSTKSTTTQTLERFGVPMTFYLELTHTDEPEEAEEELLVVVTEATEPEVTEPEEKPTTYNVTEIDFDALSASTENKKLLALNDYVSQLAPTNQNAYTGLLSDYNLILICAESFSPAAVDPVLTPTLYRLTQEGFLFRNYYCSYPNTTIDGEYTLMQGLYPDGSRGKENSSMLASATNSVPYALGNLFAQRGVKSWGYHNNIGSYYGRNQSHPNMGYEMKFNHSGMELTGYWPTSDLEMMEQTVDDYIHEDQFHAYYMTFSGHYQYKTSLNAIAAGNYDLVKDLPDYDEQQKCYLACHIELDRALEYLLRRLEEEGKADKTAIVMAADHIPYGLLKKQYFGMIGEPEDFFSLYKSDLIFWVGGMENVEVTEYCSNVDVLPTILNLWGFPYDSRLLPGKDVFSDGLHAAVLIDRSFLTDSVWFNSNTGEVRYQKPETEVPENYVENLNRMIASRFDYSSEVLKNDYFRFVLGS